MFERLKKEVFEANMLLPRHGLVTLTWGNVSGIDRERGVVVIKPSGVDYGVMKPEDMVAVDLFTGQKLETGYNPSSDTPTHLVLYRAFDAVKGIVHTHSRWATVMAQAGLSIPALGTTHADYFYGEVPCTRELIETETEGDYEHNTGAVIAETFKKLDSAEVPAVLVKSHGPFTWGKSPKEAVEIAVVLEEVSFMAWHNMATDKNRPPIGRHLLDRHYLRKHGKDAYYGQKEMND